MLVKFEKRYPTNPDWCRKMVTKRLTNGPQLAFFYRWSSQKVWNSVNRSPQSKLFFSTIWSNLELVFCSNKLPKFITPLRVIFWILGLHPKNFIKVRKIFQGIVLPVCTKNCLPFWKINCWQLSEIMPVLPSFDKDQSLTTVDGRNSAPVNTQEIPFNHRLLYIPSGAGFSQLPPTLPRPQQWI